ncbi:MAG: non-ribosomal peptide synthetase, partial [Candidatus Aminicenantes bacterium]
SAPPGRRRQKIYRTGDLARWLPTGEIEFLGRIDHQVKIRGFRIELEEIEEQLVKQAGIKEAVVIVKESQKGDKCLVAYIVPEPADKENEKGPDVELITQHLSQQLPHYMIPSYFVPLENIPLTPNGKVDRAALPEPGGLRLQTGVTYVEPGNEMEEIIASIWQKELGLEKIGVNDNFFDLGGNSMNVVRFINRLNEMFKKSLPVVSMFKYRTIRTFSHYLDEKAKGNLSIDDRSNALKRGERDRKKMFEMRKRSTNQ